jgi:hypothetical protein
MPVANTRPTVLTVCKAYFVFMGFVLFYLLTSIISLNGINQLIFVMVKCGVLFEVRTEFLNNI